MKQILIVFLWLYASVVFAGDDRLGIQVQPYNAVGKFDKPNVLGGVLEGMAYVKKAEMATRLRELQSIVGQYGLQTQQGRLAMQEWRMLMEMYKAETYR